MEKKCPSCRRVITNTPYKRLDEAAFIRLINEGIDPKDVAHMLGVTSSTIYRKLTKFKAKKIWRIPT